MKISLKTLTPDIETTIVEIARVSSQRLDKKEEPEGLINYLIKNKHWSPFQHGYLTFEIDTSKAIAIQFLRHLSFTFQEFSQRYAEVEGIEEIEFRLQAEKNRQSSTDIIGNILPDFEVIINNKENSEVNKIHNWIFKVSEHLQKTFELYQEGIQLGVAKECARMILPMASKTKLYMTGSVRSWIHLLEIRDDSHAQKEAQLIAKNIKKEFIIALPLISKALKWN